MKFYRGEARYNQFEFEIAIRKFIKRLDLLSHLYLFIKNINQMDDFFKQEVVGSS